MMQHAWDGYAKYAWGKNEVRPVSLRGHTASIFGQASMGATIVDSLDTLYIMGMIDEYEKARGWVESELDFNKMVSVYCTVDVLCRQPIKQFQFVSTSEFHEY